MASNRPIPTALKIARGNPGKKALNKSEPQPSRKVPACPAYLSAQAKAQWEALVPELARIGVMTAIDGNAFARYCDFLADYIGCLQNIATQGEVGAKTITNPVTGEVIQVVQVNFAKQKKELAAELLRLEAEFGLTPSARSRLHALPVNEKEDMEEKLNQPIPIFDGGNSHTSKFTN